MVKYEVPVGIELDEEEWNDIRLETEDGFKPTVSVEGRQMYIAWTHVSGDDEEDAFLQAEATARKNLRDVGINHGYSLTLSHEANVEKENALLEI